MTQIQTTTFTITDPREFDGDPFQVAQRAIQQSSALAAILTKSVEVAELMARNTELERALQVDKDRDLTPVAGGWPESPQGRQFRNVIQDIENAKTRLDVLMRAAAYNPKQRVKAAA